ncbi:MAG: hypothetical protein U1E45_24715 [Geminicoccaceae bacterium]
MGRFSWIGAAALVLATSAAAEASDRSVQAVMIPPMACQPIRNAGAELVLTSWIARAGASADLVCPVPFNNIELGTPSADNDLTSFRIHYSDSDGTGTAAKVSVSFYRFNNSSFSVRFLCSRNLAPATTALTATTVPCVEDVATAGTFYAFLVQLTSPPNGIVTFRGIDFP